MTVRRGQSRQSVPRPILTLAPFRESMVTLERQVALDNGEREMAKAELAKANAGKRSNRAPLVYAPPIDLPRQSRGQSTIVLSECDETPEWVDVAFWISPDGSVRDIDVARQSDNAKGRWTELVRKSLAGRLYRPLALPADDPGLQRIERYSLFYILIERTSARTRLPTGSPTPSFEITDLTIDAPAG